jgi:hypothetical protein
MISVDSAPRTPPHHLDRDRDKGDDDESLMTVGKMMKREAVMMRGLLKNKYVADGAPGRNLVAGIAPRQVSRSLEGRKGGNDV